MGIRPASSKVWGFEVKSAFSKILLYFSAWVSLGLIRPKGILILIWLTGGKNFSVLILNISFPDWGGDRLTFFDVLFESFFFYSSGSVIESNI